MAIAIPPEFRVHVRTSTQDKSIEKMWRLPSRHEQDLRDVARGLEETNAGVCTKYLLDELTKNIPDESEEAGERVSLFAVEQFCDRYHSFADPYARTWRNRINRARRALARMSIAHAHTEVGTLHVVYGYPDPSTREWPKTTRSYFGELCSLVRYTDAVEAVRRKLIRAFALSPSGKTNGHAMAIRSFDYERECSRSEVLSGLPKRFGTEAIDFSRVREREEYADRFISSGDALTHALLTPFTEAKPVMGSCEPTNAFYARLATFEEKAAQHSETRAAFLVEAKADAERMLSRASRVYHEAWLASAYE